MCSAAGASSRADLAFGITAGPLTASCCVRPISFTIAMTSDCLVPGAQYSSAAEGGLPMVHSPATQRLALKWRPISVTAVNRTLFTLDCRGILRVISVTRAKLSTAFSSYGEAAAGAGAGSGVLACDFDLDAGDGAAA